MLKNLADAQGIYRRYYGNWVDETGKFDSEYVVLIMWDGILTENVEHRSAAFEEYADAEEYAKWMLAKYKDMNIDVNIYINGSMIK